MSSRELKFLNRITNTKKYNQKIVYYKTLHEDKTLSNLSTYKIRPRRIQTVNFIPLSK